MAEFHSMDAMTRAGCASRRAVRLWEEMGLLGEVPRSAGDTRQFTDEHLDRAKIIAAAQFGGWPLDQIRAMLVVYDADMEVYDAITTRLADQMRAAARLAEALPRPLSVRMEAQEFDL